MSTYNGEPYPGFFISNQELVSNEITPCVSESILDKWSSLMNERVTKELSKNIFNQEYMCQFETTNNEPAEDTYKVDGVRCDRVSLASASGCDDYIFIYDGPSSTSNITALPDCSDGDVYVYDGSDWTSNYTIAATNAVPSTITINNAVGNMLVSVDLDGNITYSEDYSPDAAAETFWQAIAFQSPSLLKAKIEELEEYVTFLEAALSQQAASLVLSVPVHETISDEEAYDRAMRIVK